MGGIGYYYTEPGEMELVLTRGRPRAYPWHMHARHWTIGVVRSGGASLLTRAGTRRLTAGEHFFVRPYEPHSLSVEPESALLSLCLEDSAAFAGALRFCSRILPAQDMAAIEEALFAWEEGLSSLNTRQTPSAQEEAFLDRSVRAVIRLIVDNPGALLSVGQMAAYAGYSQWHFLRGFQKAAGMTPHAFQLLCRLRLLRSLLRADTASSAAAASAGFSDQSHMHKAFKRQHGMTPGQFRRASFKLAL